MCPLLLVTLVFYNDETVSALITVSQKKCSCTCCINDALHTAAACIAYIDAMHAIP
jgi:hypothetical protein